MVDVYMKRSAKIYMVLLVWIAAALQFFINEKMDMEEVFASMQEADTQLEVHADISVWGVYEMADSEKSENKDSKDVCPRLTPTKINNLLLNTAGCFGVSAGELTVTGRHDSITTFQSNGDPAFWRFTFIDNSVTGQGYLVVQTDRIEAVDQIHTFFDNLNIKEMVSVEADIYADFLDAGAGDDSSGGFVWIDIGHGSREQGTDREITYRQNTGADITGASGHRAYEESGWLVRAAEFQRASE